MDIKRILIQAFVGGVLFTIVSVILNGSYVQKVWIEKGMRGIIFVALYAMFLVVQKKFINKKE